MEIPLISKNIIFYDPCYLHTRQHLLDVCSPAELLVQDSGNVLHKEKVDWLTT